MRFEWSSATMRTVGQKVLATADLQEKWYIEKRISSIDCWEVFIILQGPYGRNAWKICFAIKSENQGWKRSKNPRIMKLDIKVNWPFNNLCLKIALLAWLKQSSFSADNEAASTSDNEHPQCKWSVCPHLLLCSRGRRSRLMWRGRPSIVDSAWEDFGGRLDDY